jgi:hypothetical protein
MYTSVHRAFEVEAVCSLQILRSSIFKTCFRSSSKHILKTHSRSSNHPSTQHQHKQHHPKAHHQQQPLYLFFTSILLVLTTFSCSYTYLHPSPSSDSSLAASALGRGIINTPLPLTTTSSPTAAPPPAPCSPANKQLHSSFTDNILFCTLSTAQATSRDPCRAFLASSRGASCHTSPHHYRFAISRPTVTSSPAIALTSTSQLTYSQVSPLEINTTPSPMYISQTPPTTPPSRHTPLRFNRRADTRNSCTTV